jgi:hypothetical protein
MKNKNKPVAVQKLFRIKNIAYICTQVGKSTSKEGITHGSLFCVYKTLILRFCCCKNKEAVSMKSV